MSLNRSEQRVFDYLQGHQEERQYWLNKVHVIATENADLHQAANRLDSELWRYYQERAAVVREFREAVQQEGIQRTSMKNLAEYLLRLWVTPRPKKPAAGNPPG